MPAQGNEIQRATGRKEWAVTHLCSAALHVYQTAPKEDVSADQNDKEELYQSCFKRRDFIFLTSTGAKNAVVSKSVPLAVFQATEHWGGTSYLTPGFGHAVSVVRIQNTTRFLAVHTWSVVVKGAGFWDKLVQISPLPHISLIVGNASNLCVVVSLSLKRWGVSDSISFHHRPFITSHFISQHEHWVLHKTALFSGHGNQLSWFNIFLAHIPSTVLTDMSAIFKHNEWGLEQHPFVRCANLNKYCWVRAFPANSLLSVR